ncbi:MAG: 2-amino-4-hydroxy-6-hydroxymethyldihydropteridine diphosphokinase, partial [Paracoccaceae bacterium]
MQNTLQALVAFGANLSQKDASPEQTIVAAMACLEMPSDVDGICVKACSRMFLTPCFPKGAGPDYVNAAAVLLVPHDISPYALLGHLHAVEARFDRSRDTRWGPRTLDIDLLAMGDLVLPDPTTQTHWRDLAPADQSCLSPPELILPHPRLQDRAF